MTVKVVAFTEFRKNASHLITEVSQGESLVIFRHGRPVARVTPYSEESKGAPAWKQPGIRLHIPGADIASAILQERDESL
jgi:prevent-host-death family protein